MWHKIIRRHFFIILEKLWQLIWGMQGPQFDGFDGLPHHVWQNLRCQNINLRIQKLYFYAYQHPSRQPVLSKGCLSAIGAHNKAIKSIF